jgi:hypothetical protein
MPAEMAKPKYNKMKGPELDKLLQERGLRGDYNKLDKIAILLRDDERRGQEALKPQIPPKLLLAESPGVPDLEDGHADVPRAAAAHPAFKDKLLCAGSEEAVAAGYAISPAWNSEKFHKQMENSFHGFRFRILDPAADSEPSSTTEAGDGKCRFSVTDLDRRNAILDSHFPSPPKNSHGEWVPQLVQIFLGLPKEQARDLEEGRRSHNDIVEEFDVERFIVLFETSWRASYGISTNEMDISHSTETFGNEILIWVRTWGKPYRSKAPVLNASVLAGRDENYWNTTNMNEMSNEISHESEDDLETQSFKCVFRRHFSFEITVADTNTMLPPNSYIPDSVKAVIQSVDLPVPPRILHALVRHPTRKMDILLNIQEKVGHALKGRQLTLFSIAQGESRRRWTRVGLFDDKPFIKVLVTEYMSSDFVHSYASHLRLCYQSVQKDFWLEMLLYWQDPDRKYTAWDLVAEVDVAKEDNLNVWNATNGGDHPAKGVVELSETGEWKNIINNNGLFSFSSSEPMATSITKFIDLVPSDQDVPGTETKCATSPEPNICDTSSPSVVHQSIEPPTPATPFLRPVPPATRALSISKKSFITLTSSRGSQRKLKIREMHHTAQKDSKHVSHLASQTPKKRLTEVKEGDVAGETDVRELESAFSTTNRLNDKCTPHETDLANAAPLSTSSSANTKSESYRAASQNGPTATTGQQIVNHVDAYFWAYLVVVAGLVAISTISFS